MSHRRLYLDESVGERRGVVTLDGLPERLFIERHDDHPAQQPGAVVVARARRIDRTLRSAFLDLGQGPDAVLPLAGPSPSPQLTEGAWLEVEIVAPPRGEKGAVVRLRGLSAGPNRLLFPAPSLEARLQALAPGVSIVTGPAAREAADIAEDAALRIEHALPGGGRLFIEQTQALAAIDVDLGAAGGESRKAVVRANQEAIVAAARLLRLKGLGGLAAIDLAGKGHDGAAFSALAKTAFAPDGSAVSIGPISRFGIFELSLPRTATPTADRLLEADGRPSAATMAYRLLRAIEDAAGPGQRVEAVCAPEVAAVAEGLAPRLADRIGARFVIRAQLGRARTSLDVAAH